MNMRKSRNKYRESVPWFNPELINTRQNRRNQRTQTQQQNDPPVNVFGIFTEGSLGINGSDDFNDRQARYNQDIIAANQIWGQCGITFVEQPIIISDAIIDVTTLTTNEAFPIISDLINEVKQTIGNPPGIYVVYTSGNRFGDGVSTGVGGVIIEDFEVVNDVPDATFVGSIGLSNDAANFPFTLAHEAGHVFFSEFNPIPDIDPVTGIRTFNVESIDPTSNDFHSNDPNNLMAATLPNNPIIEDSQCQKALMSRLFQNGG